MSRVLRMWEGMTGTVLPFAGGAAPSDWLLCDGQAVSRDDYANLFAVIGTAFGDGDGSTTFNLPDLRGEFIRGLDAGRGVDADRVLGSAQLDALQNIEGSAERVISSGDTTGALSFDAAAESISISGTSPDNSYGVLSIDASLAARTADETRPRNIAMNYIIKA